MVLVVLLLLIVDRKLHFPLQFEGFCGLALYLNILIFSAILLFFGKYVCSVNSSGVLLFLWWLVIIIIVIVVVLFCCFFVLLMCCFVVVGVVVVDTLVMQLFLLWFLHCVLLVLVGCFSVLSVLVYVSASCVSFRYYSCFQVLLPSLFGRALLIRNQKVKKREG